MLLLVTERSVTTLALLASVAELFPGTGSVTPAGTAIVAVLAIGPVVPAGTMPSIVKVAAAPAGRSTSVSRSPLPLGVQVAPPVAVQVHVKPVRIPGRASCTRAAVTLLGPALLAVTV